MNIYTLDPLVDRRWDELVAHHSKASVFHESRWLDALHRSYGYQPFVLTTAAPGQPLESGIPVCRVASWVTGHRLVSLPFSDHCEPLLRDRNELPEFAQWLRAEGEREQLDYLELRPLCLAEELGDNLQPSTSYWFHELDLTASLDDIFQRLHDNSFKRKIQRAERERLSYEKGASDQLMAEFYGLLCTTRQRHHSLPQPRSWFRNLRECMGKSCQIMVARKEGVAIAAMLTLERQGSVVYKYGCSDERFHSLGGMPFLFWKLIVRSKSGGATKIDLGRSDLENEGLIQFKDRLGANRRLLTYYRNSPREVRAGATFWASRTVRQVISHLPRAVSAAAGKILYRHVG